MSMLRRFLQQPSLSAYVLVSTFGIHFLGLASTIYVMQVFNRYVGYGLSGTLITLTTGVVVAMIFELLFRLIRQRFMNVLCSPPEQETTQMVGNVTATAMVEKLSPETQPRNVLQTLEQWHQVYSPTNLSAVIDAPFALLFLFFVALLSPVLALIVLGALGVALVLNVLTKHLQRSMQQNLRETQRDHQSLLRSLEETDTVRTFNIAPTLVKRWQTVSIALRKLRYRSADQLNNAQSVTAFLVAATSVAVVAAGSVEVVLGQLTVGAVIGANILSSRALAVLTRLIGMASSWVTAEQAHQRLGAFLQTSCERTDGVVLGKIDGSIEFHDLEFQYPGAVTPIVERLHGKVEAGEVLVITGGNGVGKTTMMRLLTGIINPSRGHIMVDGYDLRQVNVSSWRQQLVYLPQEPKFFEGTLVENLQIMNPGATEEDMMRALEAVGLDTFVRRNKDGLRMPLTAQAERYSYGVRRRLALVRALLSGGKVWLLDEIAEGIDPDGLQRVAALVQQAVAAKRTLILASSTPDVYAGARKVLELGKPSPSIVAIP